MKQPKVQLGYRVEPEIQEMIKQHAKRLIDKHGFYVFESSALAHMVRMADDKATNEPCKE